MKKYTELLFLTNKILLIFSCFKLTINNNKISKFLLKSPVFKNTIVFALQDQLINNLSEVFKTHKPQEVNIENVVNNVEITEIKKGGYINGG